jgi:hypothetical protein
VNRDGQVDGRDVLAVLRNLGKTDPRYDVNRSGRVTLADAVIVLGCAFLDDEDDSDDD